MPLDETESPEITKEGEEVDFLLELQPGASPRWLAIEAKLGIQNVEPLAIPPALSRVPKKNPEVMPGGEASACRDPPCGRVAQQRR
ncbi:MAG TPA: hypothetical protein VG963_13460 [Polyangiaceae bacterium]|nr:hypothetical protein [Polyangiaceae bacterium]